MKFIKGEMGGDEIVLLYGIDKIDEMIDEKEVVMKIFSNIGGHQIGFLYRGDGEQHIKVKIMGRSAGYIGACGGLFQVLGRALVEFSDLRGYFGVDIDEAIYLDTDSGRFKLRVGNEAIFVDMTPFVEECYRKGVERLELLSIKGMRVGEYLVINADDIKKRYPAVDFEKFDDRTKDVLKRIQAEWNCRYHPEEGYWWSFCLYDFNPRKEGHIRAIFPHSIVNDHIEPACGTGSVAIAIAIVEDGELEEEMVLETGGGISLGGPELSILKLKMDAEDNKKVKMAEFTHSKVDISAKGELSL